MKYSIVIPTYNHCNDFLKPCLDSIFKFSDVTELELIISANGCTDNTFEYLGTLKSNYTYLGLQDNFKIVWNNAPLGYGKATNVGINVATTDNIVLLNNDAMLLGQAKNLWLNLLSRPFNENEQCGITCNLKRRSEITNREFAVFFCAMVHRKVFDKIGLLDEAFGVGGNEDIDFSIRAENAGFEIVQATSMEWSPELMLHVGSFPVYHKGEGTVHDTTLVSNWEKIFSENELRLAQKYNPEWYKEKTKSSIIAEEQPIVIVEEKKPVKEKVVKKAVKTKPVKEKAVKSKVKEKVVKRKVVKGNAVKNSKTARQKDK